MSQVPSDYEPGTDFSTIAATPILTTGLPGAELDAEFAAIAETANHTISRLSEIQRDDGQIRNGIVKMHTLASDVLALLVAGKANIRGQWQIEQSYNINDIVSQPFASGVFVGANDDVTAIPPATWFYVGPGDGNYPEFSSDGANSPSVNNSYPWWSVSPITGSNIWLVTYKPDGSGLNDQQWSASLTGKPTPWSAGIFTGYGPNAGDGELEFTELTFDNVGTYIAISDHLSSTDFDIDILRWAPIATPPSAGNLVVDTFTGDGSDTTFVLTTTPISEANTQVFVNGDYKPKNTYSLAGSTITFAVAPANLAVIEVVSGVTVEVQTAVVADASVGTDQLLDDAVTTDKVADGAITADKLAAGAAVPDDSITAAKLQSNAVTTNKISAGSVTEGKLASGAVTEDKLGNSSVSAAKVQSNAITTAKIADANVTAAKLGASAVETSKINDSAVTTAKIGDSQVTNAKVADATLTAAKFVSGTLDSTIDARPGVAKVACRFTLSSSPALVGNDVNVASVTNTGTGVFRVTFTTALASANYIPQVDIVTGNSKTAAIESFAEMTTTYVDITVRNNAGSANNGLNTEAVMITIYAP